MIRCHHPGYKPLAAAGMTSYRYKGPYGFVMIGAKDNEGALQEANRSLTSGSASIENLQVWNGSEYVDVQPRERLKNGSDDNAIHAKNCAEKLYKTAMKNEKRRKQGQSSLPQLFKVQ